MTAMPAPAKSDMAGRAWTTSSSASVLPISHPDYPPLLRTIDDPPPLLYLRGNPQLLRQPQLAVVGSRRASPAALRITRDLCGDLVWGLYDTGAARCLHCHYTCHVKCQKRVRLNCSSMKSLQEVRE